MLYLDHVEPDRVSMASPHVAGVVSTAGIGQPSTETVTYNGSAGRSRWRVCSYSGAGAYTLEVTRP